MTAAALIVTAFPAAASHNEVTAAHDDPPGCTKATSEDNDGCGAKGRDHFNNARHVAPVQACASSTAATGSRLTRILPDGPRRADNSLAFISGACVYLPPGYDSSGLRYPVIHLFHGGGGDQADWVTFGAIQQILDRAYASDPARAAIVVMADGRSGQFYDYEDGRFLIETYVLDHLVPYVDRHFRTIADRAGRAIAGLSNGGYGALHFAGKRPDYFVAAGGMSSNIGARTLGGLGPDGAVHYQGSVPYQLAENYDGVDMVLDVAAVCTAPDPLCATIAVDLLFTPDHVAVQQRMQEVQHQGAFDLRHADGAHQFTWWSKWLEERQLPFIQQRLADPRPASAGSVRSRIPASFRYRSIKPRFSVWGYDVTVTRAVREFLDLRNVGAAGLEVQGSGRAVIKTAAYYEPGAAYRVSGVDGSDVPVTTRADDDGRLTVEVDLGPSHASDQFTDEADLAAAQGDYWTVRKVTISPAPGTPPLESRPPLVPRAGGPSRTESVDAEPSGRASDGALTDQTGPSDGRVPTAISPVVNAVRKPQLLPTVLFVGALTAGAAWAWRRRLYRKAEA